MSINSPESDSLMRLRRFAFAPVLGLCLPVACLSAKPKPCVTADEASKLDNKEVCLTAHVYDIVELTDGTRFLDVCSPETPDDQCRFTIVSFFGDRDTVGELLHFRNSDVRVRGVVEPMDGRARMVLSHERQFRGGPPKFRPNPRLLHGFDADTNRPAIRDPNLRPHGSARSFMDRRQKVRIPTK